MELQGDLQAMFGALRAPGQAFTVAKDGRGFAQVMELRSMAQRVGLRDRTAFHVEERPDCIEVVFMNIAPGSPLRKRRGPAPVHRPWHDLEAGRWIVLRDVKNPASLRVQVSQWAKKAGRVYSVTKVPNGYRIWRRE
ncbi:hypothetical protein y223_00045 [Bordetella phage PY223]